MEACATEKQFVYRILQVLQKKVDLSRSGAKILGEFVMSAEKDWTQPKLEMAFIYIYKYID